MPEFAFDVTLTVTARVMAPDEDAARALLHGVVDCVDMNGTPGSIVDGVEIDGEAPADDRPCIQHRDTGRGVCADCGTFLDGANT